jgi:SpoVK/Ycf46/Vps4 family AAA+-type ATPase
MGQRLLGSAVLHHLEGYHVQNLDLASLLGQSNGVSSWSIPRNRHSGLTKSSAPSQTVETAIVQMFVEAKRHQPSVLYIPSLVEWSNTLAETSRATVGALLDSLGSSEPVLLLALVDGDLAEVPYDVRSWFGYTGDNAIHLDKPSLVRDDVLHQGVKTAN